MISIYFLFIITTNCVNMRKKKESKFLLFSVMLSVFDCSCLQKREERREKEEDLCIHEDVWRVSSFSVLSGYVVLVVCKS